MDVKIALAERIGYPVTENYPEVIAAVDEGTMLDNPGWYEEEIERARKEWGGEMGEVRHFEIDIPDVLIQAAFNPVTTVDDAQVKQVDQ